MTSTAELKRIAARIRLAALAAADPRAAVVANLSLSGNRLAAAGREAPLDGRLVLAAVGKASAAMAEAALGSLGDRVQHGLIVMPDGYRWGVAQRYPAVEAMAGGHPVPDERGREAARCLMDMARGLGPRDVCVLLLSGGGSALLPLPRPPVSLEDKKEVTALLLASGADISEINVVRKHLSAIKGGRLAEAARGSILTLAVSDVVGDSLASIASGPTVPDPSRYADAIGILQRHGLWERAPDSVRNLLEDGAAGKAPETPKSLAARHEAVVISSNRTAVEAAMAEAAACGFTPVLLTGSLSGEAREAGRMLAAAARQAQAGAGPVRPPACLIAGGETTVTVKGSGRGGRNQEIALSAAIELSGTNGILLASFATDGKEGNTDAAGATASGDTAAAGRRAGLDPAMCLKTNDSHSFLSAAGELIVTGPTGTNVNDISFALVSG